MNEKNDRDEFPDRSQLFEGGRVGVLLVHGLGGTPTELRFVAQGLARAGRTVLCCQLAGHCSTPEELRRRVKELERELEAAKLRAEAYSLMIDLAEKELKVAIRKKSDTK